MTNKLTDARRSLERAKESAQARLLRLEEERQEIKASLKSLDAALKALQGSDGRARARKSPPPHSPSQRDILIGRAPPPETTE